MLLGLVVLGQQWTRYITLSYRTLCEFCEIHSHTTCTVHTCMQAYEDGQALPTAVNITVSQTQLSEQPADECEEEVESSVRLKHSGTTVL